MVDKNELGELLTVNDAAALLGIHPRTLRRHIAEGLVPVVWMPGGTRQRIRKADLAASFKRAEDLPPERRRYNPGRGGHAPGLLREAFTDWIDQRWRDESATPEEMHTVTIDDEERPIEWLIGRLWNCTDILPGTDCDDLDIPPGSTYAVAVRKVREVLATEDVDAAG